ncbi:hypothetical protein [Erwinia pyrifoliae]|uniref:hypothetical protein n=1 Tax=Erwinia pyrifoliae TaxID=79967 RepID=UPI002200348A|nr:hypothetical protein [Erwinia pyrifoliae]UWS30315.1 hypothetical protein NYP81_02080 [Erwinia pyrifoliae]UXK13324.1 hypothetical protein NYP80_05595 [Erwinia pyrifoliae]
MADPLTPIINQLANIFSFKSALRLLLIAAGVIVCWVKLPQHLMHYHLPSELSITLVTLVGFALGALFSSLIFSVSEYFLRKFYQHLDNKKKRAEIRHQEILIEEKNVEKIAIFKRSFVKYSPYAKEILVTILRKDTAIKEDDFDNSPRNLSFRGLVKNEIVTPLEQIEKKHISALSTLYTLLFSQIIFPQNIKKTWKMC